MDVDWFIDVDFFGMWILFLIWAGGFEKFAKIIKKKTFRGGNQKTASKSLLEMNFANGR